MRGEDMTHLTEATKTSGSPPHARGRHRVAPRRARQGRITPACAGKTSRARSGDRLGVDHPRMRGEDAPTELSQGLRRGSPPHARGRHRLVNLAGMRRRITPACAGKTTATSKTPCGCWDHPRMRGEDPLNTKENTMHTGSPPHARGRRIARHPMGRRRRITPACAGKTDSPETPPRDLADHPRMRGEDFGARPGMAQRTGSPPHARGRRRHPL